MAAVARAQTMTWSVPPERCNTTAAGQRTTCAISGRSAQAVRCSIRAFEIHLRRERPVGGRRARPDPPARSWTIDRFPWPPRPSGRACRVHGQLAIEQEREFSYSLSGLPESSPISNERNAHVRDRATCAVSANTHYLRRIRSGSLSSYPTKRWTAPTAYACEKR